MKRSALALIVSLLFAIGATAQSAPTQSTSDVEWITNVLYPATVLLYTQEGDGSMTFTCTATAFEKKPGVFTTTYHFATAAHCVSKDNKDKDGPKITKAFVFLTSDAGDERKFYKGKVLTAGVQSDGNDYALIEVKTHDSFPIVPLGKDPTALVGEKVVNVASPSGLGKQVFFGYVSSPRLDRPVVEGDVNWTGALMLQMFGVYSGSSGSAVVCQNQRAICGFILGTVNGTGIVANPVSRFSKALAQIESN